MPRGKVGSGLSEPVEKFHGEHRAGGVGARWFLPWRHLRRDQSSFPPGFGRLAMGAVESDNGPVQVVLRSGNLSEYTRLVFFERRDQDGHGLSRSQLVAASGLPGNH